MNSLNWHGTKGAEILHDSIDYCRILLFRFSEEQALHIIYFNGFDHQLSECDLDIYRPLVGLQSSNNRNTIREIVEKIKSRIVNHENRDLNLILTEVGVFVGPATVVIIGRSVPRTHDARIARLLRQQPGRHQA